MTEQTFEEDFAVSGTITVVNHNPEDAMTVSLSDVLSDNTAATITACTGDADLTDGLTIAKGGSSVCDYSATLTYDDVDNAPTNNTATAVLNELPYTASDTIEWMPFLQGYASTGDAKKLKELLRRLRRMNMLPGRPVHCYRPCRPSLRKFRLSSKKHSVRCNSIETRPWELEPA